jgi:phosphopantetheinyl transferase
VAVGPVGGGAIGVDIECEGGAQAGLAERAALVMSRDELARWHALDADARAPALMRAWVAREAWFKAAGAGAPWDFRHLDCAACAPREANVRSWEVDDLRVALSARDADALAAASCEGWPEPARVDASFWCARPLARNSAAAD